MSSDKHVNNTTHVGDTMIVLLTAVDGQTSAIHISLQGPIFQRIQQAAIDIFGLQNEFTLLDSTGAKLEDDDDIHDAIEVMTGLSLGVRISSDTWIATGDTTKDGDAKDDTKDGDEDSTHRWKYLTHLSGAG